MESIFDTVLALAHLKLGRATDSQHRNSTRESSEAAQDDVKLIPADSRRAGLFSQRFYSTSDLRILGIDADKNSAVSIDLDSLAATKLIRLGRDRFCRRDDGCLEQEGEIFESLDSLLAELWRPDDTDLDDALEVIDYHCLERIAIDLISNNQQRTILSVDILQQWDNIRDVGDRLVHQQDSWIL
jgi:hypothetical protein